MVYFVIRQVSRSIDMVYGLEFQLKLKFGFPMYVHSFTRFRLFTTL
jgi:hypothetical protein